MTETVNHATPISLVAKIVTFKANVTSAVKSTDLLVVYATTKTAPLSIQEMLPFATIGLPHKLSWLYSLSLSL